MSQKTPTDQLSSGYAEPLFQENKPKWTDERLVGGSVEKTDVRYHDKEKTLKITNGLCTDIFFRAEDIEREDFQEIPDFAEPQPEYSLSGKKVEHKKPLDSKHKKRTYILSKELPPPSSRGPARGARSRPGRDGRRPRRRRR
ncbi:MAG: hypothetical protein AB7J40_00745 [Candidatus Altimarinota bacterium]